MTADLNLWPIGNCQVSGLIDSAGSLVWGCVPRVDGDPVFCALLDDPAEGRNRVVSGASNSSTRSAPDSIICAIRRLLRQYSPTPMAERSKY